MIWRGALPLDVRRSIGPRLFVGFIGLLIVLDMRASVLAEMPAASARTSWMFEGRVYEGETGQEPPVASPLHGVTVGLYRASNAYPDPGTLLRTTTTDIQGWYGLTFYDTDGHWEYYSVRETDPAGFVSVGATSVSGIVRSANWIEFMIPLDGRDLTGNKF